MENLKNVAASPSEIGIANIPTTTIIVAHRLSTIQDCDEIIVMHEGQVIERGTHDQLARQGGRYTELLRMQQQQQLSSGGRVNGVAFPTHPHYPGSPSNQRSPSVGSTSGAKSPSSQSGGNRLSQAPAVIMGEAGGVRTMIWTSPSTQVGQDTSLKNQTMYGVGLDSPQETSPMPSPAAADRHSRDTAQAVSGLLSLGQQVRVPSQQPVFPSRPETKNVNRNPNQPQQMSPSSSSNARAASPTTTTFQRQQQPGNTQQRPHLNMERLWAGDKSQLPPQAQSSLDSGALNLSLPHHSMQQASVQWGQELPSPHMQSRHGSGEDHHPEDEDDQPMVCMICEDKATGLHYGIITCEG